MPLKIENAQFSIDGDDWNGLQTKFIDVDPSFGIDGFGVSFILFDEWDNTTKNVKKGTMVNQKVDNFEPFNSAIAAPTVQDYFNFSVDQILDIASAKLIERDPNLSGKITKIAVGHHTES